MLEDLPMARMRDFGTSSPGHEGSGVVVKVGSNVKGWKIGERGGVKPMMDVCQNCELCWDHRETHCARAVSTGLMVNGEIFFWPWIDYTHNYPTNGFQKVLINNTSPAPHVIHRGSRMVSMISRLALLCAPEVPCINV
jgi:hypothetical protein